MNVLHICSSYFSTSLYRNLFDNLKRNGVSNIVYVPRWEKDVKKVEDNIFVVNKKMSKLTKLLYWGEQKYILKDIENLIDLSSIDVIHVHRILYGGYIAMQFKKKYGIPYIVAIRNSDIYGMGRNLSIYKKHCWEIIQNAYKVIFISESYKKHVLYKYKKSYQLEMLNEKSLVLFNGIDQFFLDNVPALNTHKCPKEKQINLVSFGTIDRNKNFLTTLKACDILINQGYKVCLKIAGKIKNKTIYQKIISKPYVTYLGVLCKEEIIHQLSLSDVFVMPSFHETFGLVYAESMSQGVPVIFSKGQGFDGQFEDGEVGYGVDCKEPKEIALRVIDIVSNYRVISNRCIEGSKRYSWGDISEKYKTLYNECLQNLRDKT